MLFVAIVFAALLLALVVAVFSGPGPETNADLLEVFGAFDLGSDE